MGTPSFLTVAFGFFSRNKASLVRKKWVGASTIYIDSNCLQITTRQTCLRVSKGVGRMSAQSREAECNGSKCSESISSAMAW